MSHLLEIRVPISPTPDFFRRVHFMAASLRQIDGALADHEFVICVGGDQEPVNLSEKLPWSKRYPITWRWVDRDRFRADGYWETSRHIFRQPPRAQFVMCADADVIFVRDFSDLLRELAAVPAVAGVIAHAPPVGGPELPEFWPELCHDYGVPVPPAIHEYTGWKFMSWEQMTPVYFNFGMVLMPGTLMEALSGEVERADEFVNTTLETFFRFQIALTLAIQKANLPSRALPLRYNFPNDPRFDQNYPDELESVRILHYLRCEVIHREKDFADLVAVESLIARTDLKGSNEALRRILDQLYPIVEKEEQSRQKPENHVSGVQLNRISVPDSLQRNAPDVLADGVENTGESLLRTLAQRLGRRDLSGLDLLDLGCGVRFTQTLINRRIPFKSYTGLEVSQPIVKWLKSNVEQHDGRFHFVHWNVRNAQYNPNGEAMDNYKRIPVPGSYDVILAYSLFTHFSPPDITTLLHLMRPVARRESYFFFTAFCDDSVETFEDREPDCPLLRAFYNRSYLEKIVCTAGWKILSHRLPMGYMMDSFLCQLSDQGRDLHGE